MGLLAEIFAKFNIQCKEGGPGRIKINNLISESSSTLISFPNLKKALRNIKIIVCFKKIPRFSSHTFFWLNV